jgi:hypothetical protein
VGVLAGRQRQREEAACLANSLCAVAVANFLLIPVWLIHYVLVHCCFN